MIIQTKNQQYLLENVSALVSSEDFQRGPLYDLRISAKLWGGSQGQSATVFIYGGSTTSPGLPLAKIILTEDESEHGFTISSDDEYIRAEVKEFTSTKPGAVSVTANALEDI